MLSSKYNGNDCSALTMVVVVRHPIMSSALLDLTWLGRTWLDNLMSDVLSLLLDLTALASLSQITCLLSRSGLSFQIVLGFNRSWARTPGKHYFFLRNSMIECQERESWQLWSWRGPHFGVINESSPLYTAIGWCRSETNDTKMSWMRWR